MVFSILEVLVNNVEASEKRDRYLEPAEKAVLLGMSFEPRGI